MNRFNDKCAELEANGEKVNVAILGVGRIVHTTAGTLTQMAKDSLYSPWIHPYATVTRDIARVQAFTDQRHFDKTCGPHEELVADPDADLVYTVTPHSLHAEQAILCMKIGKNVLMEKPFTTNTGQTYETLAMTEGTGMLCTGTVWARHMPSCKLINETIEPGEIGKVEAVSTSLCYLVSGKVRMTDPVHAGDALLGAGVYPLDSLDMVIGVDRGCMLDYFDTPMVPAKAGVDAQNSTTSYYGDSTMVVSTSSMLVFSDRGDYVWGIEGYLVVTNINSPEPVDIYDNAHKPMCSIAVPPQLTGYKYEMVGAANVLPDGKIECEAMPHADAIRIMELTGVIRDHWGLKSPFKFRSQLLSRGELKLFR